MGRSYCEHGYPEEDDNLGRPMCSMCRALVEVYGDRREQRRYEIARDVMAALCASNPGANTEIAANDAVYSADVLLAALEETER